MSGDLRAMEQKLLDVLADGAVHTPKELLVSVLGRKFSGKSAVPQQVCNLRKKIKPDQIIWDGEAKGYRLVRSDGGER
jgi:DNA-binding winged helix-turn-helix (wHTH) protein